MSAGKFMYFNENNQLPTNFYQYFKSVQTFHKYPTRIATGKKFLLTQGKLFPRPMLPQIHWTQGMVRNKWPYQVSISLRLQTSVQKWPTLSAYWCKETNGICLTRLVLSILCDLYRVLFYYVLLYILYLTDTVKLPFILGVNLLHLSVIW